MQTKKISLIILVFFISQCSYVNAWKGDNYDGQMHASFKDLNGNQKLKLVNPGKNDGVLKYKLTVSQGILELQIKSKSGIILHKLIKQDLSDSVMVSNPTHENFVVILKGSHSSGTCDIIWE